MESNNDKPCKSALSESFTPQQWTRWADDVLTDCGYCGESHFAKETLIYMISEVGNAWIRGEGDISSLAYLRCQLVRYYSICAAMHNSFLDVLKALKIVYDGVYYERWLARNGILIWKETHLAK